ncbi:MAG: glycosyltransferase family 39 protein [Candidatus Daviesbacteria bacterium]|nr:glycosyltransferase family 39 protein [Candidatus Daviesbacteria bacterium]
MSRFLIHNRNILFIFGLLVIVYFILRLPNLTIQPIFADEAIYIRWAQIMKAEPTLRFISLTDGKTPLFMWAMIPLFKFINDPLMAGRLLSVFSGLGTLLGVIFLCWRFFDKSTAFWAALLIVITPFVVFFDRMALVDSMLAAFSIWALNFSLLLIRNPRFDLSMVLGYILGGGMLTKTPGLFNVIMLPVAFLTFIWSAANWQKTFLKTLMFFIISAAIAMGVYNLLRLGVGFSSLSSRNQDYIFPFSRLLSTPLDPFIPHLKDLADWFPKLFTPPILLFVFLGIAFVLIKRNKVALVVLLWLLGPLVAELLLLQTFTARYILSSVAPLLCLAGWGISQLTTQIKFKKEVVNAAIFAVIVPMALIFNYWLITDPAKADLPREERIGYFEDWTAGYGFSEIANFLMQEAQKGLVIVGTEGSFGTLPDGLAIYLDKYSHTSGVNKIVILGGRPEISDVLRNAAEEGPVYFIANRSRVRQNPTNTELVKEYPKASYPGAFQDAILVFKVLPSQ